MTEVVRDGEAVRPWTDPNAKPFIRIRNITKKFGEFVAVDNVSLDIFRGELFCLLGGSGCGKSTLLRMLAGFETPTSGTVEIDGQDMTEVAPHHRPTNMMFQSYALFPHMTVERNIGYGLRRAGVPRAEIERRVAEMIDLVQLGPLAKRKPHQLSGGQRQRVALARSLIKRPKLLLLDEPLGALDKKLREETQFELVKIEETLGVTFVVVTHDQEEAMTLATRIGVMRAGEIVQVAEPREVYEYPNSKFVAEFIGSVNMFEGRVVEDAEDHVRISSPEAGCDIHVSHGVSCAPNQQLWFAVRPEKVQLHRTRPGGDANVAGGVVEEVAYMGTHSTFRVKLDSGKLIRVARSNVERSDDGAPRWDDRVFVSWGSAAGVGWRRMTALAEAPRTALADTFGRAIDAISPLRWTAAAVRRLGITGRGVLIAVPTVWLFVFFLVPFLVVAKISLSEAALARPPYLPIFDWTDDGALAITLNFANYRFLLEDPLYVTAYLTSIKVAAISTGFTLLIGYPMAYYIARSPDSSCWNLLLMLVILPFWTSFLLRVYAWMGFLSGNGVINNFLLSLGIIDQPLVMLQTDFAVYVGIVYTYLPFMILPLYTSLVKLDGALLEAASDLGARPFVTFLTVTLPLSLRGIVAGSMLVIIPAIGEFVIPSLLGGPDTLMIGRVLWDEFFSNRDWPVASAVAIAMLFALVIPMMLLRRAQGMDKEVH